MIVAADNLTSSNPAVAAALKSLQPQPLQELARRCEDAGAALLDLNPGYLSPRHEDRMAFMVDAVQSVTGLRLILDSPHPRVLARGLAACRDKPILNACTLEEAKLRDILPLAAAHHTDLVLLLLDDRSFAPPTLDGKMALAVELREHALAAGVAHEQLIFDPVLPNLRWPDAFFQLGEALKAVRLLTAGDIFSMPGQTMAGLSNLRSGLRHLHPLKLEETCLSLLAGGGLSFVLTEVLQPSLMKTVRLIKQMSG